MPDENVITFNTGRLYVKEGQQVTAVRLKNKKDIMFFDHSRGVRGVIRNCQLLPTHIMTAYDLGQYESGWCTPDEKEVSELERMYNVPGWYKAQEFKKVWI